VTNLNGVTEMRRRRPRRHEETEELEETDTKKLVVTLGSDSAEAARAMAEIMGTTAPETIRRGLSLLRLALSLREKGETLAVYDRATKESRELVFAWDYQLSR
jgi:hypothetical protein